jgi:hypothetical protein
LCPFGVLVPPWFLSASRRLCLKLPNAERHLALDKQMCAIKKRDSLPSILYLRTANLYTYVA